MRRWALLVALVYGLLLAALALPVYEIANTWTAGGILKPWEFTGDELYRHLWGEAEAVFLPFGWPWLLAVVLAQACFLAVPAAVAAGRPVARRALWQTVLAASFMMALLMAAFLLSVQAALIGEKGPLRPGGREEWWYEQGRIWWANLAVVLAVWVLWAWAFRRAAGREPGRDFVARTVRFLMAGSLLEFLVAVPSHVWVRRREECCAPIGSLWGIAMGIAVMLFSFGPGVLFLYADRIRRKRGG